MANGCRRPGFNANGIAETPDHRALLVVQSATETLFRVNPRTGVATQVDLGGYALTNGDGLLVRGRTLYVVQNQLNQVAVFKLNRRGTAGALVKTLPVPDSDVPTTVAAYRGSLYLPNARFGIDEPGDCGLLDHSHRSLTLRRPFDRPGRCPRLSERPAACR